jgi:hypothetical protein
MKHTKKILLALAILIPQPAHAGWWETFSNWFVQNKRAALCAVGIGATCAVARTVYQRYYSPQGILNGYLNEIESKLNKENLGLSKDFWGNIERNIRQSVYKKSTEDLKPEFEPFGKTILDLFAFIEKNKTRNLNLDTIPIMKGELAKIRTSMNEERRSAS